MWNKGRKRGGQGGEKRREIDIHIPITDRLPIRQELRFMDHWQGWMHVRKVQIDKAFLNMHRRHCDVMFLLQQMCDVVSGARPLTNSR